MDLTPIYAIATVIAVITAALSQTFKVTFNITPRFMPLVSLVIGMLLGLCSKPITEAELPVLLWAGAISGLMASGLFDAAKKLIKKEDDKDGNNSGDNN